MYEWYDLKLSNVFLLNILLITYSNIDVIANAMKTFPKTEIQLSEKY